MSKIPLGGGAYIEPDEGPRNTPHHKRIVKTAPIPQTMTGQIVELECGHIVHTFGKLERAEGKVLCTQCRDGAT
jgi:hypothetical protein